MHEETIKYLKLSNWKDSDLLNGLNDKNKIIAKEFLNKIDFSLITNDKAFQLTPPVIRRILDIIFRNEFGYMLDKEDLILLVNVNDITLRINELCYHLPTFTHLFSSIDVEAEVLKLFSENYVMELINNNIKLSSDLNQFINIRNDELKQLNDAIIINNNTEDLINKKIKIILGLNRDIKLLEDKIIVNKIRQNQKEIDNKLLTLKFKENETN